MSIKKGNRRRHPHSKLFKDLEKSILEIKSYNKGRGTLFTLEFPGDHTVIWIEHYNDGREVSRRVEAF
jgi:hypothetical protein